MMPDLDFISALGEEFCEALSPSIPEDSIVPMDALGIWRAAFPGVAPTPRTLAALTTSQVALLREAAARYFETPTLTIDQIQSAIARTQARWPSS